MEQSPEQWLASMQARADEMVRQSQEIQQSLQEMSETAAEPDGAVAVTVSANGALKDLHIDKRALHRGPDRLKDTILQLAGQAQAKVAGRVVDTVEPVAGSAGLDFLRTQLPADPEAAEPRPARPADDDFDDEPPQTFLR
ncbi:YbaB/EbfC family DNA-binding protein [Saccharopolyspora karakumensis]|uniref:YbaB/EbfC family DNA-binding protein n=1 Tax=Saccharopolyspora karakumensis TaxID=2530386 RepID=A0A4V2YWK4_9PSEU|nr:YbaB/EbfC family nucleoid-associated protein [Saccharopolyspora karakumensis]TDD85657.1 YbaB/EbfC family DNA-binding protein [Saccharopolyspora karakumensis]